MRGRTQSWGIFLRMPWGLLLSDEEVTEGRNIIGVAEAVYTAWLGAYSEKAGKDMMALCPYGALPWSGACSHSPLLEPLRKPLNDDFRRRAYAEYYKQWSSSAENRSKPAQSYQTWLPKKNAFRGACRRNWSDDQRAEYIERERQKKITKKAAETPEERTVRCEYHRKYNRDKKAMMDEQDIEEMRKYHTQAAQKRRKRIAEKEKRDPKLRKDRLRKEARQKGKALKERRKSETESDILKRQGYFKEYYTEMKSAMDDEALTAHRLKARDATRRYRARKKAKASGRNLGTERDLSEEPVPKPQAPKKKARKTTNETMSYRQQKLIITDGKLSF